MNHPIPPILVTGFNRPLLLREVLNNLQDLGANYVWVSIDGPRNWVPSDCEKVHQSTQLIEEYRSIVGERVKVNEENLGCKYGMFEAISWFFSNVKCGIIIEDDIRFQKNFLSFMSLGLRHFEEDDSVGSIAGYMPLDFSAQKDFSDVQAVSHPYFSAWGWGTWSNRWEKYNLEMQDWRKSLSAWKLLRKSNIRTMRYWTRRFDDLEKGLIDTWDFQFLFTHFLHDWRVVAPKANLVRNVGFGEEATHTKKAREVPALSNKDIETLGQIKELDSNTLAKYLSIQFGI